MPVSDYNYIDAKESKSEIVVWGRDFDGNLITEYYPLDDYLYCFIPDNTGATSGYRSLDGTPMRKVSFQDKWSFRDYGEGRSDVCESDVPPVTKFLMDVFSDAPLDAPYNILYYDIEVDYDLADGLGYPTPENPHGEISSFQAFDSSRKCYVIFAMMDEVVKLTDPDFPVEIYRVSSERELLKAVVDYIDHIDILAGWYTDGFDLPYIMVRLEKLFGSSEAATMLCRGGFKARSRQYVDQYGQDKISWTLVGRQHLDMMELYKKFIPGEKQSFSLDAVCEEDLGENKTSYDGDLGDLYRENPQVYFDYALQDGRLLMLLDKKHHIIRLAMTLARMNSVFATDVSASVHPIETGFISFCHEKGVILPNKKNNEKEAFPGAIVYDTIAGRHGWAMTIDLTALYPSAMIMLGLSTETVVAQCIREMSDYVSIISRAQTPVQLIMEDTGEVVTAPAYEIEELIRENGFTISANGTIFNGELGLLSEYVQNRFAMRKHYQKLSKEAAAAGDTANADVYDLYQKVMKIVCNSLYGCISNAYFRLFDIRLAKSITLTGRVISKHQASYGNALLEELLND